MSKKLMLCVVSMIMAASVFLMTGFSYGEETDAGEAAVPTAPPAADSETVAVQPIKPVTVTVGTVTGVKAKGINYCTIRITWKKVSGASGYQIYRYSKTKKQYVQIKTVGSTGAQKFNSTKLSSNRKYVYRVKAYRTFNGKTYFGKISQKAAAKTKKTGQQKVIDKAKTKLGASYRAGASGPRAFDCSGYVYWVYKNAKVKTKKRVKRTSSAALYQSLKKYKVASGIRGIKKAQKGDIVFFKRGGRISHTAIYAGSGKIIHARSSGKGVQFQRVRQLHNSGTRVAAIVRIAKK